MTYIQHLKFSLYISRIFLGSAFKAVVHAFIPFLFITSSSDTVYDIALTLKTAGCKEE
jgi:hypothetical protein